MNNKQSVVGKKQFLNLNIKHQNLKTNEKGITIISLVITIIVVLILTGVTINMGTGSVDNSKIVNFLSYMQTIQGKVDFISEHEDYSNYGQDLTGNQINTLNSILSNGYEIYVTTTSSSSLKYFNKELLASDFNIENVNDEIVIDFTTREVISLNGISYKDKMYYSQYFLPGGQKIKQNEVIERNLSIGDIVATIDGLNATIALKNIGITNGTISYGKKDKEEQIEWVTITNYTKKDEDIVTPNITETGTYYFKLVDNTTGKDNQDSKGNYPSLLVRLTNSPMLKGNLSKLSTSYNYSDFGKSENWAFATDSVTGKRYVWIPRYAYKTDNPSEIEFLRGTSDITTSQSYINTADWTIPDEFAEGKIPKTGVWVQVSSLNQKRNKYIKYTNNRNYIIIKLIVGSGANARPINRKKEI